MLKIRKSQDRGKTNISWLKSDHTFSFGQYFDSKHMHFDNLRVINEDWIAAGQGFGMHPHQDMEIITYIVEGELTHKDNMGNEAVIRRGDIQRMTAGTGVMHSEYNSSDQEVHLLQIWILPAQKGLSPSYEQKKIPTEKNQFHLIGSHSPKGDGVKIHQNVNLYQAVLTENQIFKTDKKIWVQMIKGETMLNGEKLEAGDAAAIEDETKLHFENNRNVELLLFEMG